MNQVVDDSLEAGREAAQRRAWREAYELLRSAGDERLTPEDIENLADAAWWTGRLEEAIELRERGFAASVDAGEPRRAAMLAMLLAMDYSLRGALSVAGGWIARGERLLASEPDGIEHGHLASPGAPTRSTWETSSSRRSASSALGASQRTSATAASRRPPSSSTVPSACGRAM